MNEETFRAELRRMASTNGIFLPKEDKLIDALRLDIDEGASFVNIFRGANTPGLLLIVTSLSTIMLRVGMFSVKVAWEMLHEDLRDVRARQSVLRQFVMYELELVGEDTTQKFEFALLDPNYEPAARLEIAAHNCQMARDVIRQQWDGDEILPVDEGLTGMHRAVAPVRAGPPIDSESTKSYTANDFAQVARWMSDRFQSGNFQPVWERRCALGYGISESMMARADFFWINAYGALAGLYLGFEKHGVASMCAGYASTVLDYDDPRQVEAMRTIEKLPSSR